MQFTCVISSQVVIRGEKFVYFVALQFGGEESIIIYVFANAFYTLALLIWPEFTFFVCICPCAFSSRLMHIDS